MSEQLDLLGDPIGRDAIMRKSSRRKGGYAARPGSGPKGQRCNTCAHFARLKRSNVYTKCLLMAAVWTRGPGTDIKARAPACSFWERKPPKPIKVHDDCQAKPFTEHLL